MCIGQLYISVVIMLITKTTKMISNINEAVEFMKTILCFGDSNTYGLIPGTTKRYAENERWTGILESKVRKFGYRVVEEGLCGRTTIFDDPFRQGRRGTELLPTILETHSPIDTVIVMLGTNDCKTFYDASAEIIGLGVKKIIEQIKKHDATIKILLVSPIFLGDDIYAGYDLEFGEKSVKVSKKLGEIYKGIAKKEQIDFLAAADYAVASEVDREHLDKIGHKKLSQAIFATIQPKLICDSLQ